MAVAHGGTCPASGNSRGQSNFRDFEEPRTVEQRVEYASGVLALYGRRVKIPQDLLDPRINHHHHRHPGDRNRRCQGVSEGRSWPRGRQWPSQTVDISLRDPDSGRFETRILGCYWNVMGP